MSAAHVSRFGDSAVRRLLECALWRGKAISRLFQLKSIHWLLAAVGASAAVPSGAVEFDLGLRYDRSRSGHGLEIHRADDRYAVFFYTYRQDLSPEWYLCDGRVINGLMQGDCLRYTLPTGTPPPALADGSKNVSFSLDYVAPDDSAACEDGVDRNGAEQLAVFSWRSNGEFRQWCTEFLRVGQDYPEPYYGGIWYGGDGGYGCSLSHMDETLSAICYYYDEEGEPRWAIGLGGTSDESAGESIEMIHYQGFCRDCTTTAPNPTVAGSLTVQLAPATAPGSGSDSARLSLTYPRSPGGVLEREFTMFRLTDGSQHGAHAVPAQPVQTAAQVTGWEQDLQFLSDQIRAVHPNPFHTIAEAEFDAGLIALRQRLPFLTTPEIRFEMFRLGGSIGRFGRDGHTSVVPNSMMLPLQLYWFSNGVFVVDALPPYEQLVGAQLTHVGQTSIEEVLHLLGQALSRDNQNTVRWISPTALLFLDLYRGLGIVDDSSAIPLMLTASSGESARSSVEPISLQNYDQWKVLGRNTLPERPVIYLSDTERPFWFAALHDETTMYIQYNAVVASDPSGQTIEAFSRSLKAAFDAQQPSRVVVDLRHNNGGDNTTYGPLLTFLSDPGVNQENRLFAIIGRQTFSAAMNFIADLEADTKALFVGEGSGGSPFHFGDSQDFVFPNSQMLLQISSRVHQSPNPDDQRLEIPADIPVALSSIQFFANQDPVLQAILDQFSQ